MSDTAARARLLDTIAICEQNGTLWTHVKVADLKEMLQSVAPVELKADTLFGVYCSGNPESIPRDHAIFWEGWQRVADYVNGKLPQSSAAPVEEVAREIDKYYQVFEETPEATRIAEVESTLRQHGYGAQGQGVGQLVKLAIQACDGFDAQPNHGAPEAKSIMDDLRKATQFFSTVPAPESATKEGK